MSFNQEQFFDGLAQKLHDSGALKTYDKPKGCPMKWGAWAKEGHNTPAKDTPGEIHHLGDEPYSQMTSPQLLHNHLFIPRQSHINQKTQSARDAIAAYFPEDGFAEYLEYFRASLDEPSHKGALIMSISNIKEQLTMPKEKDRASIKEVKKVMVEGDSNKIRATLAYSDLALDAPHHPELLLAVAVYQAAHVTYLSQLEAAINRNPNISEDERENAKYVVEGPFSQFRNSLVFASIAPLTLLHYREMSEDAGQDPNTTKDPARMKEAIGKGWEDFFDKKVLKRTYNEEQLPPEGNEKGGGQIFCPAIKHLQETKQRGQVEGLVDFVHEHKAELQPMFNLCEQQAHQALGVRNPRHSTPFFR